MIIPTEPIGSIPRPLPLIEAFTNMDYDDSRLEPLYKEAILDTIERFEATDSPVITDGEQRKYHNLRQLARPPLPRSERACSVQLSRRKHSPDLACHAVTSAKAFRLTSDV